MSEKLKLIIFFVLLSVYSWADNNTTIDSIRQVLSGISDDEKSRMLTHLSDKYLKRNNLVGLFCADEAYAHALRIKDRKVECKALIYRGAYKVQLGQFDSALVLLSRSKNLAIALDNIKLQAASLDGIGNAYLRKGDVDSARSSFSKILELSDTSKEYYRFRVNSLNALAIIHYRSGDFKGAVEQFIKLYELSLRLGDKASSANCAGNIAGLFYSLKNYSKALSYYRVAQALFDELGLMMKSALTYENIGMVQKELGVLDSAIINFKRVEPVYKEMKSKTQLANLYQNMSDAYLKQGFPAKADEYASIAIDINEKNDYKVNLAESYLFKALSLIGLGRSLEAGIYIQKATKYASMLNQVELQVRIAKAGYTIYKNLGSWQTALTFLEQYNHLNDSILSVTLKKDIADLEAKYESTKKEQQIQQLSAEKLQHELTLKSERKSKLLVIGSLLLVLITGLLIALWYRSKHIQKQSELSKEVVEIENRLLRTQMNPHFLFNSLNSVQRYIGENNPQQAQVFLSKFSGLIRNILDSSMHSFITLEKEVETLDLYLTLEQQRFQGKFDFNITVDEALDSEFVEIPPMLVQPFVENSIIHGFAGLDEKGMIDIRFKRVNNLVECTIIDNGLGINATKSESKSLKSHKSVGMQVTRDRLRMLNQKLNFELKADTVDLSTINPSKRGTQVSLTMPLVELE
ncbi:MAG: tetratricopeptide repeat protein [Bacteroidales bacterium]